MRPDSFQIANQDAKLWLSSMATESVDLLIVDPPYASKEKHRGRGAKSRFGGGSRTRRPWFAVVPDDYFPGLFVGMYRVLRMNRHCYVFCDFEMLSWLVHCATAAGFLVHKPLVWDKQHFGMGYHYRAQYEFILFMSKGKRRLNDNSIPDVLSVRKVFLRGPAEKPFELIDILVRQSTKPGELVVDPFVGSGVAGEAAINRECVFWGNDSDAPTVERAQVRLHKYVSERSASLHS